MRIHWETNIDGKRKHIERRKKIAVELKVGSYAFPLDIRFDLYLQQLGQTAASRGFCSSCAELPDVTGDWRKPCCHYYALDRIDLRDFARGRSL
jgi:hypothetical protein